MSFIMITAFVFNFDSFKDVVPYIGPSLLGGTLGTCLVFHRDKIEELEKEIKNLKDKYES